MKLLDGAFAAIQLGGDFANTLLLRETQEDYFTLVFGQCFNCAKESRATFYLFEIQIH